MCWLLVGQVRRRAVAEGGNTDAPPASKQNKNEPFFGATSVLNPDFCRSPFGPAFPQKWLQWNVEWTREQMKLVRRNLIGRTGIIVDRGKAVAENSQSLDYVVVTPTYVPFVLKENCLQPLSDDLMLEDGGFVAAEDTESCCECCRTFPSQVQMRYAVHKNHRPLLCRDCMLQERSIQSCCLYEHNRNRRDGCLNGIANLLDDKAMQNMLVKRHVKVDRFADEWEFMACYGRVCFDAIADSDLLHGVVAGFGWDRLVSLVKFSRKLDNAVYFGFPSLMLKRPFSCTMCRKTSPALCAFPHICTACTWPIFCVCVECKTTICNTCLQSKTNVVGRCDICSGDFVYPKERGEYNYNGFQPIN